MKRYDFDANQHGAIFARESEDGRYINLADHLAALRDLRERAARLADALGKPYLSRGIRKLELEPKEDK